MKLGLVQMSMTNDLTANLDKSLKYCEMAKNCDLVFFPEIQLTPFSHNMKSVVSTIIV